MTDHNLRKKLTIQDIARISGLSTATVDRVLNNRPGVKESTRLRVEQAMSQRSPVSATLVAEKKIAFVVDAGSSFIEIIRGALSRVKDNYPHVSFTFDSVPNHQRDQRSFCDLLKSRIDGADGVVLVSREDILINSEVREAGLKNVPVVCLTSDMPHSAACIGVDEVSVGANAALFIGRMIKQDKAKVLFVASSTYRTQEEREMGFRRVMRAEFPHIDVIERIDSNDESDGTYKIIKEFLTHNPDVAGIYNLAGGNRGIARAIKEAGLTGKTLFVGHELTEHTHKLLEQGEMDILFAHDMDREVNACITTVEALCRGERIEKTWFPSLIYTKYSRF
ncbi:LacI family DNA-binding transcriptional regulator [Erwiniaceae bacterium L1_54_3]|nr:LacI family DNA-binding transcriptional regulator [Erwiniaceae bacterium L1_54_3]